MNTSPTVRQALVALIAALVAMGASRGATASDISTIAVIELFTSQGCSSCPPADALMQRYADRNDVVALTMPVDYWDYLGWKDTLASPKFSARQRHYAKARGDGAVYTPQVVVNGTVHVNGSDQTRIDTAIQNLAISAERRVSIRCRAQDGVVAIDIGGDPSAAASVSGTVWLAVVRPMEEIVVRRGENNGRKLAYFNVVRELTPIGMWSGKPLTVQLPQGALTSAKDSKLAILLQEGTAGRMIAAAWSTAGR
jgi:hypothetical protein